MSETNKNTKAFKQFFEDVVKTISKNPPTYCNFLRNLRKLRPLFEKLLEHQIIQNQILYNLEHKKGEKKFLFIDSTKIETCNPNWNGKIGNKKINCFNQEIEQHSKGYNFCGAFKGYKLNNLIDEKGRIINMNFFTGKVHDVNVLEDCFFPELIKTPFKNEDPIFVIGDSGYVSKDKYQELKEKRCYNFKQTPKQFQKQLFNFRRS